MKFARIQSSIREDPDFQTRTFVSFNISLQGIRNDKFELKLFIKITISLYFFSYKLTKTWHKEKTLLKPLKAIVFQKKRNYCLFNCEQLSKRESWGTREFQVLSSFVKPHKAVTLSTVSRWL